MIRYYFLVFLWFFICPWEGFSAGPVDSLKSILEKELTATERIGVLNQLIYAYAFQDPRKAIELKEEMLFLLNEAGNLTERATFSNSMGIAHNMQGEFLISINYFLEALKIHEANRNRSEIARLWNNLGATHDEIREHQKAKIFYFQSLAVYQELKDYEGMATIYNNLGICYSYLNNMDSALLFYKKTLSLAEEHNLPERKSDAFINIGDIYMQAGKYKEGLKYAEKAHQLDQELNNQTGLVETYRVLAEGYIGLKQFEKAYDLLDKSMKLSHELGTRSLTSLVYRAMSRYYTETGDPGMASTYQRYYQQLEDSIFHSITAEKIENLQLNYEIDKKLQEIELLNEINLLKDVQLNSEKARFRLVIAFVISLLIILILVAINYRMKVITSARLHEHINKISDQNRNLEDQGKRLQELSEEKDNMISLVAHDLKSPLSKISGLTGLIRIDNKLSPNQLEYLGIIDKVIGEASHLIKRMLDIKRIESSDNAPSYEWIFLIDILKESTEAYLKKAMEKNIHIVSECPDHLDLKTDRDFLMIILDNLLSNAIKFSEPGKNVYLHCHKVKDYMTISIRDEGPGIPKEELSKLFKKYSRLSTRPTGGESSTGLGLAIVKLILDKLHGKIEVNSEPKTGTEFRVYLPT